MTALRSRLRAIFLLPAAIIGAFMAAAASAAGIISGIGLISISLIAAAIRLIDNQPLIPYGSLALLTAVAAALIISAALPAVFAPAGAIHIKAILVVFLHSLSPLDEFAPFRSLYILCQSEPDGDGMKKRIHPLPGYIRLSRSSRISLAAPFS